MRERERERERENEDERRALDAKQPCPLCDAKPLAREIEQHLRAAHPEDIEADGSLKASTIHRLYLERTTPAEREGAEDSHSRRKASVKNLPEGPEREQDGGLREQNGGLSEQESLSGEGDMAKKQQRGEPGPCGKCGKFFQYEAFRRRHEANCDGTGAPKKAPSAPAADETPAAPAPDGSAPNLAIAADALRTQAKAYRKKADRLEEMATELEG